MITKSSTSAPVEEAVNAISWAHHIARTQDPTQSEIIKQVLAGAKYIQVHKTAKEPITPEILSQLVYRFAGVKADLDDVRVVTWCLIDFAGFLRYSELATLKESDLPICLNIWKFLLSPAKRTGPVLGRCLGRYSPNGNKDLSSEYD